MKRTCINCRWSSWSGPHLGCYFNHEWRVWLPQREAKAYPVCETGRVELEGCRWEPTPQAPEVPPGSRPGGQEVEIMSRKKSPIEEFLEEAQAFWLRAEHVQVGDKVEILDEPTVDRESFDRPYLVCRVRLLRTGDEYNLRLGTRNTARIAETLGKRDWKGQQLEVISIEDYPGLGRKGILWRGVKVAAPKAPALTDRARKTLRGFKALIEMGLALSIDQWNALPGDVRNELTAHRLVERRTEKGVTRIYFTDRVKKILEEAG